MPPVFNVSVTNPPVGLTIWIVLPGPLTLKMSLSLVPKSSSTSSLTPAPLAKVTLPLAPRRLKESGTRAVPPPAPRVVTVPESGALPGV